MLVVADAQGSLHWREIIEADEHGENLQYRIQPCLVTDIQLAAAFGRLSCKLHNRIMSKELWKPSGCGRPHHYHRNHPKFNKFLKSLQNLPEHFNWDVLKKNSSLGEHSLMRARVDAAYSVMALVKQTRPCPIPSAVIQEAASFPETALRSTSPGTCPRVDVPARASWYSSTCCTCCHYYHKSCWETQEENGVNPGTCCICLEGQEDLEARLP